MSVAAPCGRADRYEHGIGFRQGTGEVGGEGKATIPGVVSYERLQPRLEDRDLPAFKCGYL